MYEQPLVFPSHEEIRQAAWELWHSKGDEDGHDVENWLEAEKNLFWKKNVNVLYQADGYVSPLLRHFIGKGEGEEEKKYELLVRILKGGVLKNMKAQGLMRGLTTKTEGTTKIDAPPSGTIIGRTTVDFARGGGIQIEHSGIRQDSYSGEEFDSEVAPAQTVCFCDIPEEHLSIHMQKFGRFGIAFAKSFMIKLGANPVFYIAKDSMVDERIDDEKHGDRDSERLLEATRSYRDQIKQLQAQLVDSGDSDAMERRKREIEELRRKENQTISHEWAQAQGGKISREALFKKRLSQMDHDLLKLSRALVKSDDRANQDMAWRITDLQNFFATHIRTYIKPFDTLRENMDEKNYYMEREWRVLSDVHFTLVDIEEVIVPAAYAQRIKDDTGYQGHVNAHNV